MHLSSNRFSVLFQLTVGDQEDATLYLFYLLDVHCDIFLERFKLYPIKLEFNWKRETAYYIVHSTAVSDQWLCFSYCWLHIWCQHSFSFNCITRKKIPCAWCSSNTLTVFFPKILLWSSSSVSERGRGFICLVHTRGPQQVPFSIVGPEQPACRAKE